MSGHEGASGYNSLKHRHCGLCYSHMPPREFFECEKAIEDFRSNPPVNKDPTFVQQQNDSLCLELFTQIQSIREELVDHVLVEPMAVRPILLAGFWGHLNFKAKHKDADDSSSAIYFAELDTIHNKVTCLIKLDNDLSADTSAYERCAFCHPTPEGKDFPVSGVGCVYHHVDIVARLEIPVCYSNWCPLEHDYSSLYKVKETLK